MKDVYLMLLFLVQIPLQLEYVKTKEDIWIEISMLLVSVTFGVAVLYAVNIKNRVVYTKGDIFADYFIALFVVAIAHYAMLFYHLPYPRFIVDFFVSFFAYIIVTALKKVGEKRIRKIIDKAVDLTDIKD